VKSAAQSRGTLQSQQNESEKDRSETQYLTRMLIFASMAYVITSIPYRLIVIVLLVANIDMSDICHFILYNLLITVAYGFWIWNFALNFYMYCAGGGKRYKTDITDLCRKCCPQQS
jgi:hypothetical protein